MNVNGTLIGNIIVGFLKSFGVSLLNGFFVGILASLIFKHFQFLAHNPISASVTIIIFGYLSFIFNEKLHYAGSASILIVGWLMAHYMFYNLTKESQI